MRDELNERSIPAQSDELAAALERELDQKFDLRVIDALEHAPAVDIPAGFAARIAAAAPAGRASVLDASIRRTYFGYGAMLLSVVALFVALVLLASQMRFSIGHSAIAMTLEWLLFSQLIGLSVWLSVRRSRLQ